MVVVDWATLIKKRAQPDQWDLFFTHHGFVPDPILISVMNDNYPGWWATAEKHQLAAAFTATNDPADRKVDLGQDPVADLHPGADHEDRGRLHVQHRVAEAVRNRGRRR